MTLTKEMFHPRKTETRRIRFSGLRGNRHQTFVFYDIATIPKFQRSAISRPSTEHLRWQREFVSLSFLQLVRVLARTTAASPRQIIFGSRIKARNARPYPHRRFERGTVKAQSSLQSSDAPPRNDHGYLIRTEAKHHKNSPDMSGEAWVDHQRYDLAGWVAVSKKGRKYLNLKFTLAKEGGQG
jgi:hypothetical protein